MLPDLGNLINLVTGAVDDDPEALAEPTPGLLWVIDAILTHHGDPGIWQLIEAFPADSPNRTVVANRAREVAVRTSIGTNDGSQTAEVLAVPIIHPAFETAAQVPLSDATTAGLTNILTSEWPTFAPMVHVEPVLLGVYASQTLPLAALRQVALNGLGIQTFPPFQRSVLEGIDLSEAEGESNALLAPTGLIVLVVSRQEGERLPWEDWELDADDAPDRVFNLDRWDDMVADLEEVLMDTGELGEEAVRMAGEPDLLPTIARHVVNSTLVGLIQGGLALWSDQDTGDRAVVTRHGEAGAVTDFRVSLVGPSGQPIEVMPVPLAGVPAADMIELVEDALAEAGIMLSHVDAPDQTVRPATICPTCGSLMGYGQDAPDHEPVARCPHCL